MSRFAYYKGQIVPSEQATVSVKNHAFNYGTAVFAGILLPLPRLGLQPGVVARLGIEGEGLWIEQPHTVLFSGMLYFALVAWSKFSYSPAWGLKVKSPRRSR